MDCSLHDDGNSTKFWENARRNYKIFYTLFKVAHEFRIFTFYRMIFELFFA